MSRPGRAIANQLRTIAIGFFKPMLRSKTRSF